MNKIKVIMIDAFKPDYLRYAPYLKSLTEKYQHGELEMTPGHWGAVQVLFEGKSDILALFYKDKDSLKFLRNFLWLKYFGKFGKFAIDIIFNGIRLLKGYELFRIRDMPLDIISKFDVSVKRHFAKKKNIDFIYFGELDKLAHKYGIDNFRTKKAIEIIDRKISEMKFDLIFSDHGMINVSKIISVPITSDCFIDSDMARYWGEKEELNKIKEKLPLEFGEILDWENKKYGQLIFMAKTGALIFPNFWEKKPSKAMHGYDGKHKDMKAFYIIRELGYKKDLKVNELYSIIRNKYFNKIIF